MSARTLERSSADRRGVRQASPGRQAGFELLPTDAFAAALVLFVCMQSLGPIAALAAILLLGAIMAIRWRSMPRTLAGGSLLLLLPLFAILSAGWSDVPAVSLRYGVQVLLTILIGIAIAATVPLRRLPLVVFVGTTAALLLGVASGRTGLSEQGAVLIGFSGSKNQMGFTALFCMAAALCVAGSRERHWLWRILGVLSVPPALFLIWQSDSMTANVSTVAAVLVLALLAVASWFPRGTRQFAVVSLGALCLVAVAAAPQIEAYADYVRSDVLGKDRRLTGRTLLWEAADRLIEDAPVVGHGYKSIWMGPIGVGLLARNDQKDGRSYHFHDTWRELRVDLGLIGLTLFLVPLLYGLVRALLLLTARVTAPRAFVAATLVMICLRMRTELIISPFLLDTVLLYTALGCIARMKMGANPPKLATIGLLASKRPAVRKRERNFA